jgi:C-terminal processing protease CtpA/Prc
MQYRGSRELVYCTERQVCIVSLLLGSPIMRGHLQPHDLTMKMDFRTFANNVKKEHEAHMQCRHDHPKSIVFAYMCPPYRD